MSDWGLLEVFIISFIAGIPHDLLIYRTPEKACLVQEFEIFRRFLISLVSCGADLFGRTSVIRDFGSSRIFFK